MVYKNIEELCLKKNIKITQLEKKAGLGRGTIGKWKTYNPTLKNLTSVADALNVSVNRLLRETKNDQTE